MTNQGTVYMENGLGLVRSFVMRIFKIKGVPTVDCSTLYLKYVPIYVHTIATLQLVDDIAAVFIPN